MDHVRKAGPPPGVQDGSIKLTQAERRERVQQMVLAGYTQRAMAAALGVTKTTIHRDYKAVLNDLTESAVETAKHHAAVAGRRLNRLIQGSWADAIQGDHRAFARVMRALRELHRVQGLHTSEVPLVAIQQNFVSDPSWVEFRGAILAALEEHPEARAAVIRSLESHVGQLASPKPVPRLPRRCERNVGPPDADRHHAARGDGAGSVAD